MFKFLKDTLKGAIGKFSKEVEKDTSVEKKEILVEAPQKKEERSAVIERNDAEEIIEQPREREQKKEEKKGFFQKIFGRKESEEIAEEREELLEDLEKPAIIKITEDKNKKEDKVEEKSLKNAKKDKKTSLDTRAVAESSISTPKQKSNETKRVIINKKIEVPEYVPAPHEHAHEHSQDHSLAHHHEHAHPKSVHTQEHEHILKAKLQSDRKKNELSIIINSNIPIVFEFTTNPKNTPQWIDSIVKEETNEYPIKVGTIYRNLNKKNKWTTYNVTSLEANALFELKQENSTYTVQYKYEAISPRNTRLTYAESASINESFEPFSITTLEKLKSIIEKSAHITKESDNKNAEAPFQEPKKGFFTKITETFTKFNLSEEKFEELFWELEVVLLENNVAVEVIEKIKSDMKKELLAGKISRSGVEEIITKTLRNSITELFDVERIDLLRKIKEKRRSGEPYIIAIIGVNGSGKTTSIAKLAHMFQKQDLKVVLAASDTFRAAAIQQLEEHATRLDVKIVKHDYNSDPAAVAFDAIKYAQAREMDVVIIDTAGRLHSNTNLMRELEKVVRVCNPDIKIFVGESITGNDCVEQAKEFDRAVGIDAIILAKADVDEKGGAAISVSYVIQKPILYLGTGQGYDDLKEFDPKMIIESLEL